VDIAEVAQRSGIPASTLRFYEEKGLIASIGRRGLRCVFDLGVLERLALIAMGRARAFRLMRSRSCWRQTGPRRTK
jgi:DNA-binding transcriptional MerR regulator